MNRLDLNSESILSYFLYSTRTLKLKLWLTNYLFKYQDDTIQTTIQKNNIKKFQAQLREGQLYSLSIFRADTYKEKDSYRPISKDKKINFLRTTVIEELKEVEITISHHKFEFVDYRIIVDCFDSNKQLTSSLKTLKFIFK